MHDTHAVIREEGSESGFTLIELMVVVLIIAILVAVLIPTFVGATKRAQDRAMQSSLHNALTAAKVVYSDHGDYTDATVGGLRVVEPALQFVDSSTTPVGQNAISVSPVSASYIVMSGRSKSGLCFFLSDDEGVAGVGVQYAKASGGTCTASGAPPAGDPAWGSTW